MNKRAHIIFRGHVQGVGFRYKAKQFAESLLLKGLVKNLLNGNVEITTEGDEKSISELVRKLHEYFSGYVSGKEINWTEASGEFRDFRIAY